MTCSRAPPMGAVGGDCAARRRMKLAATKWMTPAAAAYIAVVTASPTVKGPVRGRAIQACQAILMLEVVSTRQSPRRAELRLLRSSDRERAFRWIVSSHAMRAAGVDVLRQVFTISQDFSPHDFERSRCIKIPLKQLTRCPLHL